MKKTIAMAILLLNAGCGAGDFKFEEVREAIAIVESNGNDNAVGDNGRAFGRYQIWESYVTDVNRIAGTTFSHKDAHDPQKAAYMVEVYLTHYGQVYQRKTGNRPSSEVLCRIHNGGPNGWKKEATVKYWKKCRRVLNRQMAGDFIAAR